MLAYVFWHQAATPDGYEERLRAFHASLPVPSAGFRLGRLPFRDEPGYEDWYLVDTWADLGELAQLAVRNAGHDPVAAASAAGWGGVWGCVSGPAEPPEGCIDWMHKPRGVPYREFFDGIGGRAVWCRQLVLGPAPEVAVVTGEPDDGRVRVA